MAYREFLNNVGQVKYLCAVSENKINQVQGQTVSGSLLGYRCALLLRDVTQTTQVVIFIL